MTRSFVLVLAITCATGAALAGPSQQEEAKAHFKQGKAFQDVGQYDKAAEEYKAAYDIDHRPEMLFNIAQAYRLAVNKSAALEYFQKYLAAQPAGAGADEARMHVATLTKQLDDERREREAAQQHEQPPPEQPKPTPAARQPEPALVRVRGPRSLRIAGLATAGAGVIAVGLGAKFGLDAGDDADAITTKDMSAWTNDDRRTFEHGESANRNMYLSYAVGGVLVIGGAVMYFVGSRTRLAPIVAPQSAGLGVQGQF
jgi:tetratricopeptide (TPR) repeat protein